MTTFRLFTAQQDSPPAPMCVQEFSATPATGDFVSILRTTTAGSMLGQEQAYVYRVIGVIHFPGQRGLSRGLIVEFVSTWQKFQRNTTPPPPQPQPSQKNLLMPIVVISLAVSLLITLVIAANLSERVNSGVIDLTTPASP